MNTYWVMFENVNERRKRNQVIQNIMVAGNVAGISSNSVSLCDNNGHLNQFYSFGSRCVSVRFDSELILVQDCFFILNLHYFGSVLDRCAFGFAVCELLALRFVNWWTFVVPQLAHQRFGETFQPSFVVFLNYFDMVTSSFCLTILDLGDSSNGCDFSNGFWLRLR